MKSFILSQKCFLKHILLLLVFLAYGVSSFAYIVAWRDEGIVSIKGVNYHLYYITKTKPMFGGTTTENLAYVEGITGSGEIVIPETVVDGPSTYEVKGLRYNPITEEVTSTLSSSSVTTIRFEGAIELNPKAGSPTFNCPYLQYIYFEGHSPYLYGSYGDYFQSPEVNHITVYLSDKTEEEIERMTTHNTVWGDFDNVAPISNSTVKRNVSLSINHAKVEIDSDTYVSDASTQVDMYSDLTLKVYQGYDVYHVESVKLNGMEILGDMTFTQGAADYLSYYTYTLQDITSDAYITVNGESTKYEVGVICNRGGTLTSRNANTSTIYPNEQAYIRWFKADGNSSLKIIPNEGCTFDRLYNNSNDKTGDVTANGDGTYTYTLTGDAYISVVFRDNNIIQFADPAVKAICVQHWDSNGDGELSKQEAEAVTTLKADHGDGTYGDLAFKDNTTITSFDELKYFTGLTSIESGAFNGCTNLKTVVVPEGVETIADEAFKGCTELLTVSLPDGLTKIGNFAFQSAKKLFAIRLPETLTEIETYAFRYCSSLRSVVLPANIQKLGTGAFMLTGLNALNIPAKVTSVGETAVCGSSLLSVSVASGNTKYNSADNCNAIINSSTHELISGSKFAKIPEGVLKIGRYAFAYLTIDELEIPSSVGFIDFAAFTQTQLESIVCKGTTPPELGDSPFAYMLSNCKLTVPRGTRDAYIAAGWTEDIFKGGVVETEPEPVNFDLNNDSKIDIGDVTKLVNEVLKQHKP